MSLYAAAVRSIRFRGIDFEYTMKLVGTNKTVHVTSGLLGLLGLPLIYRLFKFLLRKRSNQVRLVTQFIRPFPGCQILDIGCGTADILTYLPEFISNYTGLDFNQRYIEFASRRWAPNRPSCRFECCNVNDLEANSSGQFDIALALGLLHHLEDADARQLFRTVASLLKPDGRLITYDPVFIEKQGMVAKWLISHDRGRAVRTESEYLSLARDVFPDPAGAILHDTIRLPYTVFLMTCTKPKPP